MTEEDLMVLAAVHSRRRILNHLQKADYNAHTALCLDMKPSCCRKHIEKLMNAGLVKIKKDQTKNKNINIHGRGGNKGIVLRLFVITELGSTILSKLAPAHQPQPPQPERKPMFAVDSM